MAKAKPATVVMVILVLLQVSWATARRYEDHPKHCGGTPAVMTVMLKGEHGGCACDGRYHGDHELIVALSSKWYAAGRRCDKKIRITSNETGRSVVAKVVDEFNSHYNHRCSDCNNDNVMASSPAVWERLGLHCAHAGEKVHVTWSDA